MTLYRGPGGTGSATSDADTTLYQEFLNQTIAARDAALQAETNAELAETNAETAETNAETAASAAASSASAAASSASSASSSASAASTSASNASTSASNAASSASAAATSASNASTSATNAANSATSASNSASTATTQATNASNSATAAASSASSAATSATNAASSASSASTSASNASAAQTAAEAARDAALSAYDNFDDRYLGPKASDPTLDNDGNALIAGALYFNTATNVMKVYDGSTWVAAYVSAAGVLLAVNNLSDLSNTATARANLNVPTRTGGDASGTWSINVTGNAATVTNGVYTTGDQTIAGTKTLSSNPILSAGTVNGVAYLNGSKVLTTGSALTFDGTSLTNTAVVGSSVFQATGKSLVFYNTAVGDALLRAADDASAVTSIGFNKTDVKFYSSGSEQMRLTSTGLGIGTSSPGFRLDVAGTGNFQGIQTSGSPSLSFGASKWMTQQETGVARTYYCGPNASTYQSWEIYRATSTGGAALTASFDLNGNLGLGVTPSAWSSSFKALNIGANGQSVSADGGQIIIGSNYVQESGGARYVASAAAGSYAISRNSHAWYIAPSGTAGNAISFTQAMTLDASGRLGIGTTSIDQPLCVQGAANNAGIKLSDGTNTSFIATITNANNYGNGSVAGQLYLRGNGIGFTSNSGTSTAMTLDANGNLGLGTTSPAGGILNVRATQPYINVQTSSAGNSGSPLWYGIKFNNFDNGATNASIEAGDMQGSFSNAHLRFSTLTSGSLTEKMRIDSNGQMRTTNGAGTVSLAYDARAWVNFNGQGTVAIRASGNVSSITDNGTGDYTVNFTNAMPDANYAFSGAGRDSGSTANVVALAGGATPTTTALRIVTVVPNVALRDTDYVNVAVFR